MRQVGDHDHVEESGAQERLGAFEVHGLHPLAAHHLEHVDVGLTVHQQQPVAHAWGRAQG